MSAWLEIQDLTLHRQGTPVVRNLNLSLRPGEVMAVVGPNGAGKSSLLLGLAGLIPQMEGEIFLRDQALSRNLPSWRQRVTLVFQEPLLFDTTVARNIAVGLRLRGVPSAERARKVAEVAEALGLRELLKRSARTLSGGEAQRTALARALVLEPDVLCLDEPFSALDTPTREALLQDLRLLLRERDRTTLLVTHHLTEALQLADSLAVLMDGQLRQVGPVRDVIQKPVDEAVAAFVGMESLVEGRVVQSESGSFTLDCGLVGVGEQAVGVSLLAGIRPEHVELGQEFHGDSSVRNQRAAVVTRIVPHGPYFKVELDAGFFLAAFLTASALEQLHLNVGSRVVARFKASAVHVVQAG